MRASVAETKRKTREQLIAAQQVEMPRWSQAELGPWAEAKLGFSPNVLDIFKPGTATSINWSVLLPRITCPVLLITADPAQGALVTAEGVAALKALIPQLRLAHIPAAGHSIRRDQFARYLKAVQAFLAEM
jgi:pimeloyl-ACP methyl ester carboxylesterase